MKTSQDRLREHYANIKDDDESISPVPERKTSGVVSKSMFTFPSLMDENLMLKISEKQEFYDSQNHSDNIDKLEQIADEICNQDFQLAPHQTFIRNFMSRLTPYNSLLLYHGLGTGKTCSAIGVAEEMRAYMKDMNMRKKILIVASPNVQENFRLQLFDERKMKESSGTWNISTCVGESLLKEINILQTNGMEKSYIVEKINILINKYYEFIGYTKFATLITNKKKKNVLQETFNGRMIIIDEAHNIRAGTDKNLKKVAAALDTLVEEVYNMRLLLLSATPMFDNYREIIQLMNILLKNEKRDVLVESEIFESTGSFKIDSEGKEVGKIDFARKINGLVSFVQGENPFSFPFRIFPKLFSLENSFKGTTLEYPKKQLNDALILTPIEHVDVYALTLGGEQLALYERIVRDKMMKTNKVTTSSDVSSGRKTANDEDVIVDNLEQIKEAGFGYNTLKEPLEALNIIFPNKSQTDDTNESLGKKGLSRIIQNIDVLPYEFSSDYLTGTRSMFHMDNLTNYSVKISTIGKLVTKNEGISLIFSQYIYGGIVPVAIMLEELGFVRYGKRKSFLTDVYKRTNNIQPLLINGKQATYSMITSNSTFSSSNATEINASTGEENKDGSIIKVVLITKAGSEGIDLKNIRSVHVLEPWYNMNRVEQIIGRAVRNCSHKQIELKRRNVMIYLYGTMYGDNECADLYVYRLAEKKAINIGKVSRVMKNNAIDCILQSPGRSYLDIPKTFPIVLANGNTLEYSLENQAYTSNCDYMKTCAYKCSAVKGNEIVEHPDDILTKIQPKQDSNSERFLDANLDNLKQRIRNLFSEKYFYTRDDVFHYLTIIKHFPRLQILKAISDMTAEDTIDFIYDKYGQRGRLIEINDMFIYQPSSVKNTHITMQERMKPIDFKAATINIQMKDLAKAETSPNSDMVNTEKPSIQYGDMFSDLMSDIDNTIIETILLDTFKIEPKVVEQIFLMYFYDTLPYDTKIKVFLQIMNTIKIPESSIDARLKAIIEQNIFVKGELKYAVFANNVGLVGYLYKDGIWAEGNPIYYKEFEQMITERWYIKPDKLTKYLGLIFTKTNKNTKEITFDFKIKDMDKLSNSSAVCKTFNAMFRKELISFLITDDETTRSFYSGYNSTRMCVFIHMYMRYKQHENVDGKLWFVNLEQSMFNKNKHATLKF